MQLKVKGLVAKKTAGGIRFYWEPNPGERRAGWKSLGVGMDMADAVKRAETRNGEVEAWKNGGASPRKVARYVKPATLGHIIKRYENEHMRVKCRPATIAVNKSAISRLQTWAGDQPVHYVTRARVRALRDALAHPRTGIGDGPAYKTLKMLREIFAWALREELVTTNPATEFGLAAPGARDNVWEPEDMVWLETAAHALDLPAIGFAVRLAENTGQREADLLRLTRTAWRDITTQLDSDQRAALASDHGPDAGRVMGIVLRQNKGGRPVGVPVSGPLRDEIETRFAAQSQTTITASTLITNDRSGLPYQKRQFTRDLATVRTKAVELASAAGQDEVAIRLADLQFRDLRRTCVVRLAELGMDDAAICAITGHKLESCKKILEVYMPRTTKMAGRAQVARIGHANYLAEKTQSEQKPIQKSRNSD